jgi:hypothetical protein
MYPRSWNGPTLGMGDRLQHPLFDLLKLFAHLYFLIQMPLSRSASAAS